VKVLILFLASLAAAGPLQAAKLKAKLPLEIDGGKFGTGHGGGKQDIHDQMAAKVAGEEVEADGEKYFSRKVNFRTPGVWYLWIKLKSLTDTSSLLSYDLDGVQPLHSARAQVLVQPQSGSQWVNYTRYPGFKIEVHVAAPGNHLLGFRLLKGDVEIEKILATLFYSATLEGETLNHDADPGRGKAFFPAPAKPAGGFREDFAAGETPSRGRTYHVDSENGNDALSGLSPDQAWRSLARVNAEIFQPGDAVLLKRGSRWQEGLAPRGNGEAEAWITLGAYGPPGPRPLVNGTTRPGLSLKDQSYWRVRDLQFTSDPEYGMAGLEAGLSKGAPRPHGLEVTNCVAFDNGACGFQVGGGMGYDGVVIQNCLSFCNGDDGIQVWGDSAKSCRNTVIRGCTAYSNPGSAGIWINGGENGLIEDCVAYNNACVNIWAWDAVNITMRRCEAFRGRPPRDAAGFDIDWGCQASTLEYCYSHQNEGDAFLLMGSGEGQYNGGSMHSDYNVMRYCVAEGGSPIDLIETFQHGKVYNNLSMAWKTGKSESMALDVGGWVDESAKDSSRGGGWPSDNEVVNNIFLGLDGASAFWVDDAAVRQNNTFDHNLYWLINGEGPVWRWGGKRNGPGFWQGDAATGSEPPVLVPSLEELQKLTGQEAHGLHADPVLDGAGWGEMGRLPLGSGRLKPGSPALGAGRNVVLDGAWRKGRRAYLTETDAGAYGIPMEPAEAKVDYWGNPVYAGKVSIGPQQ
jgi:hypothetical protein